MTEIHVDAKIVHEGRTVAAGAAEVRDPEGRLCVSATSMHLARKDYDAMPTAPMEAPDFDGTVIGDKPLKGAAHDMPVFGDFIETAYAPGDEEICGPKTIWMRTPRLLEKETPSPIQAMCPLADCGNGISHNAPIDAVSFLNTDLTIHIHRAPETDWLASTSESHWWKSGIGMSQAVLFDRRGPVATALQSLVLRPR